LTAAVGGISRGGLRWLPVVVEVPSTSRNDQQRAVLALLDLPADLPLVIGAQEVRPVVAQRRLGRRANLVPGADLLRSAAGDARARVEPARRTWNTRARRALLREGEPSRTYLPHGIGRIVRQMAKGDGRHRCLLVQGRFDPLHRRRELRVDPVLIVNALNQLPRRCESPRELREDLVLLVSPREIRVGAWLAVVVAQILIPREEPQSIPNDRSTEVGREVAIQGPLV